jgi:PAS domain S-box-containing protein
MDLNQIHRDLGAFHDLTRRLHASLGQLSAEDFADLPVAPSERDFLLPPQSPTGEKELELRLAKLLEENQQHKALLDAIYATDPSGIAVVAGSELCIRYANPAYRFLCPHHETDLIGQLYETIWSTENTSSFSDQVRKVVETGCPYMSQDFPLRFADGAIRHFTLQARRIDWDESPAALIVLWDTTERKTAEMAVQASERQVSTILASITDCCYSLDLQWRFTSINQPALAYFQKNRDELLGRSFWEAFPQSLGSIVEENYLRAVREQTPVHYETLSPIAHVWVEVNAYPSSEGMFVIFRDITSRRDAEENLIMLFAQVERQASELNTLFDAMSDAVVLFDGQGAPIRANRAAIQAYGFDPTSVDGSTLIRRTSLCHTDGSPYRLDELPSARARNGETITNEKACFTNLAGKESTISLSCSPLSTAEGRFNGFVLVWQDTTQLEQANATLARYQLLFDQTSDSLLFIRLADGRILEANQAAEQAYGYSHDELIQLAITDLRAHPALPQMGLQIALASQRGIVFESVHRRKDGTTFPVEVSTRGADFEGDRVNLSIIRDITERKQAEESLAAHRSLLEAVIQNMPAAINLVRGSDLRIELINPAYQALAPGNVMVGKTLDELWPDTGRRLSDIYRQVLSSGEPFHAQDELNMIQRSPDGPLEPAYFTWSLYPVNLPGDPMGGILTTAWETTERVRAMQRLRESEEKFRTTLTSIGDAVITADAQGQVTFLNPVAEALTGWTSAEAAGQPIERIFNVVNEQTHQPVENPVAKVFQFGMIVGLANHTALVARDGHVIPIEDSAAPIRSADGEITGAVMVFHDVAGKRTTEMAVRESEARAHARAAELETIMNIAPAFIWVSRDPDCRQMDCNEYGYRLLRLAPGANVSMTAPEDEHPRNYRAFQNGVEIAGEQMPMQVAARTGLSQQNYAFDAVFDDGDTYHLFGNAAPLFDDQGRPSGAVGIFIDVTELKRVESRTNLLAKENEIKERLIEQREQERMQIARDLHDGPVQALTGAILALQALLIDGCDPSVAPEIDTVRDSLQEQIRELRAYAGELRPPSLAKFGLGKAIRSHLEMFQEKHPQIHVAYEETQDGELLPEEKRLALFRIYQEAMNNIFKHARATEVRIHFSKAADQAVLQIQDNGVGFEIPEDWLELARNKHLGLVGMRERAEALDGTFEIRSQPGQGAQIEVVIPLKSAG